MFCSRKSNNLINKVHEKSLKGRIHCEIFLSRHFMKYSFRVISWNMKYFHFSIQHSEAVVQMCYVKKVFVEISQNSLENNCTRASFLIKLQAYTSVFLRNSLKNTYFEEHLNDSFCVLITSSHIDFYNTPSAVHVLHFYK